MSNMNDVYDLLIVGAGLAGMAAYLEAARALNLNVAIAEHEPDVGGELRFYPGFPEAKSLKSAFLAAVNGRISIGPSNDTAVWLKTTVVGALPSLRAEDPLEVNLSSRLGTTTIRCKTLLVCTGMFDQSRENHRIPGERPAGVVTPSFVVRALQEHALPGRQPVVYVEDRRDVEAARLLSRVGVQIAALLVAKPAAKWTSELEPLGAPIYGCDLVMQVGGTNRVERVRYAFNGVETDVACDALVFASGRRSNIFALKGSGVSVDPETGCFAVDATGQTSVPNVYAAGTCVLLDPEHSKSVWAGREIARRVLERLGQLQA